MNVETNNKNLNQAVYIQESKAMYDDIGLKLQDALNLHGERPLIVLRMNGHYKLLYHKDEVQTKLVKGDPAFIEASRLKPPEPESIKLECCG